MYLCQFGSIKHHAYLYCIQIMTYLVIEFTLKCVIPVHCEGMLFMTIPFKGEYIMLKWNHFLLIKETWRIWLCIGGSGAEIRESTEFLFKENRGICSYFRGKEFR